MENYNIRRQKKKKPSKSIKLRRLVVIIVLFCFSAILYNFYQGNQEKEVMEARVLALQDEISKLKSSKEDLKEQIEHINSKGFIEKIAREELGLVKKGEILYIIVDE
ncbi:FtsB family cell division protein [Orenia metallireducens]|nr:septum formation initiator family protein [Orenia metallireducens]